MAQNDATGLEQSLEDTKFKRTTIIATGIDVKYTRNEKRIFTIVFHVRDEDEILLVAIACKIFDPDGT